jgi:hypothetical protein
MEKKIISKRSLVAAFIIVLLGYSGCVTISPFDQYAYAQTTSIKVDALNLMDLANDDFSKHQSGVMEFETKLRKVYEYEKNRPKNEISVKLWDILIDTSGYLLGGFLSRWEKENKLNVAFINNEKDLVGKAFDQISGLESKKIKASEISQ